MPNPQSRIGDAPNPIAPPPEEKPEAPEAPAEDAPVEGRKYVEFKPSTLLKGSHYLITKTQLVEGGVPSEGCFTKPKGENEPEVTEVNFGPETGYRVPADVFGKAALARLLQEPDLVLVEG
jgi:hypothetical protein